MVIEDMAYTISRPIFEAQNQAAMSERYMINLQHKLAELTELVASR